MEWKIGAIFAFNAIRIRIENSKFSILKVSYVTLLVWPTLSAKGRRTELRYSHHWAFCELHFVIQVAFWITEFSCDGYPRSPLSGQVSLHVSHPICLLPLCLLPGEPLRRPRKVQFPRPSPHGPPQGWAGHAICLLPTEHLHTHTRVPLSNTDHLSSLIK